MNTSLVPELGQDDISLNITPQESSFVDLLNQELSLIEPEVVIDEIDNDNNISRLDIDLLLGVSAQEFQMSNLTASNASFVTPQSGLELQGGFGDYDGGNDVTFEVKNDEGVVVETYALSGNGQATLYRDDEGEKAYVFFSGTDETTSVNISAKSNIQFGSYIGDSLKIETTGSIDGESVILNNPDETGLILKSGIQGEDENLEILKYDVIHLGEGTAKGINNNGDVLVTRLPNEYWDYSFIYSKDGEFDYFSTLPVLAMNNSREIVSIYNYYYKDGVEFNVGHLLDDELIDRYGGRYAVTYTLGINNNGHIVGQSNIQNEYYREYYERDGLDGFLKTVSHAFVYDGKSLKDIHPQVENLFSDDINEDQSNGSSARDINDSGSIVGHYVGGGPSDYVYERYKAFISGNQNINLHSLLNNENLATTAYHINNNGQVLGSAREKGSSSFSYFIYSDGQIKFIEPYLNNINDSGQAAGSLKIEGEPEAIIYDTSNDEITNLNDLVYNRGFILRSAAEINKEGQIAANGYFIGDQNRKNNAFLLKPQFAEPELDDYINIGNISTFGDTVLLQGNEINLSGNAITTQGGEITFDGATTVNSNLNIDSSVIEDEVITGGGDITFASTVDSSSAGVGNLRLQAGTGNILFSETVGGEASFKNINVFGANTVTANADITSDQLVRINATGDIVTQYITSDNGRVVVSSQEKSISTLDITSGNDEGDHIILQAGDSVSTKNLLANELGIVRIASGKYLEQDSNIVGDITTESITGKRIRVESTGNFTTTGDALTHDGNVVVDAKQDITVENITANNGNVRLTSEEKSLTAKDISTIIPEAVDDEEITRKGNIILESKEGVTTANLKASELGRVNITSGEIVENDTETLEDDTILVGDIATQSITGKRIRVDSAGSFSALGDALAHDGNVVINAKQNIIAENITADNGNVRLISEEKSVTAKDITSGSEAKGNNIIIEAIEGVKTTNLNARELGVVKIKSGDLVENDAIFVGNVVTESITGKRIDIISTGSFTATGDIIAHGGKIEVAAINDISTKNVYSLAKSINLISTKGAVTVDGDLSLLETNEDLYDLQQLKEFVLDSGEDFLIGLLAQWGRNNGSEIVLQFTDPTFVKEFEQLSKDSNAVLLGRGVADIVSIIQGLAEVSAGGTASGAGVAATPVSGGTSLVLTAGGTLVVAHGVAVGNVASADLGVVVGQLSENLTKQFFEASVDTRINVANGQTASTPLNKNGEPGKAGFQHVLEKHFNKPLSNSRSVFDISPDQLKNILQNKKLVNSQVTALPGGQYKRIVDTGQTVGKTALKFGGKPTSKITIFTDAKGNLITTYPVP